MEFVSARRIQRLFRGYVVRAANLDDFASTELQRVWRGYSVRVACHEFKAARFIQSIWRGYELRVAYDNFLAIRNIQRIWRGTCVRRSYAEYMGARTIQSAWRRKRCRMRFVRLRGRVMSKTIMAAALVQRVYRGYRVRRVKPTFTNYLFKLSKTYRAAMAIQKTFRGYTTRFEYWHVLGSAIQIQRYVRGWSARVRDELEQESAVRIQTKFRVWNARETFVEFVGAVIVVQSMFRATMARKELKQRQFIDMLCNQASKADAEKTNDNEASVNDWEVIIARQREVDHAARKIQRFFLFVKAEVDREVQQEKKRRRKRKHKKHRKKDTSLDREDDLLENIWRRTIDGPSDYGDRRIRRAEKAVARELRTSRSLTHQRPMKGVDLNQKPSSRSRLPPEYRNSRRQTPTALLQTSSMISRDDRHHIPPSRLATLSRSEMDDDFDLEEAWIDAEINSARKRLQHKKTSKSRHKRSSSTSRSRRVMEV